MISTACCLSIYVIESVFTGDCDRAGMRALSSLAVLFALLAVVLVSAAAAAGTPAAAQPAGSLASGELADPDTTVDISLQPDQSAEWEITFAYELETDAERAAFGEAADEFEAGETPPGPSVERYETFADSASAATNREMEIEAVDRSASQSGSTGTLSLSFRWTQFLEAEEDRLILDDAFETADDDSWLASLGDNQVLRIHTPRGYVITSANVAFSDNTVEVEGPHTFDPDDQVRITFEESLFGAGSERFFGIAIIIAASIIALALLYRTDRVAVREQLSRGGDDTAEPVSQPTTTQPEPEPEDLSLLADDERVERLLERNDGRMRQAAIVDETDWSDAKVSQLLSSMADEGKIEKLRIGRENLITLPDVDATDSGSETDPDADDDADEGAATN